MKIIGILGSPRPSGNSQTMDECPVAVSEPGEVKDRIDVMPPAEQIGRSLRA
jgi:hypothetical protein